MEWRALTSGNQGQSSTSIDDTGRLGEYVRRLPISNLLVDAPVFVARRCLG